MQNCWVGVATITHSLNRHNVTILEEGHSITQLSHFTYLLSFTFSILYMLIYLLSIMLSDRHMFIWYWRELYISCKSCVQSNCIYLKLCFNQLWYDVWRIKKLTLSVHLNVIIKNLIQSNMRKLRQSPETQKTIFLSITKRHNSYMKKIIYI